MDDGPEQPVIDVGSPRAIAAGRRLYRDLSRFRKKDIRQRAAGAVAEMDPRRAPLVISYARFAVRRRWHTLAAIWSSAVAVGLLVNTVFPGLYSGLVVLACVAIIATVDLFRRCGRMSDSIRLTEEYFEAFNAGLAVLENSEDDADSAETDAAGSAIGPQQSPGDD